MWENMECGQKTKQNKDGYKKATCIVRAGMEEWKSVGKGRSGYRGKIRKLVK